MATKSKEINFDRPELCIRIECAYDLNVELRMTSLNMYL